MKKFCSALIGICFMLFGAANSFAQSPQETIAEVNGIKISLNEFNEIAQGRADRENLLNQIINSILLAQEAKKQNLDKATDVQQQLKLISESQLALFFYQKKVTEKTQMSNQELEKMIPPHEKKKVRFSQIVTQTQAEGNNILGQLKKGGSFEKIAKEKSIGRNAKNGGDIGFVIMNTNIFPEEVEKVIFKLKDGEMSEPIKTREGYAIFKAIERKDLSDKELESKKNYLQFKLSKEKTDRVTASLLESLRAKADVKIFDNNLKKIEEDKTKNESLLKLPLAQVNGNPITVNELLAGQMGYGNPLDSPLLKNPAFLKNIIEDKIKNILFVQEARRIGMDKDPEFQKRTQILADGVLANKFAMDVICKDIKTSEDEYKKYFEEHKNDTLLKDAPERVRVKHIMVNDEKLANQIIERVKKGEDFSKLAKEHSIERFSADKGGDLGYIQRGRMDQLFDEAAFSMKVGEVKKIERSNLGGASGKAYDIILLADKKPAGANKLEDVKDIIEQALLYKKQETKINEYIDKLKASAKITKNSKLINTAPPAAPSAPPAAPMI